MRKYVLAAAIAVVAASPVSARPNSGYIAVDIGALFPTGTSVNGKLTDETTGESVSANDFARINYKTGYDVDLIGGYDFGRFRLEAEAGYKRAKLDHLHLPTSTVTAVSDATGLDVPSDFPVQGHTRVFSGMVNGLVNFGDPQFRVFVGGGVGLADVRYSVEGVSSSDTKFAWQLLAGVYTPVSENLDLGVKYRYFRTGKLKFSDSETVDGDVISGELSGHLTSHSVLASIVYNFAPPPAPRVVPVVQPSAPLPAVVQTCPDGSTMPVTSVCPAQMPPPPPAARPERG